LGWRKRTQDFTKQAEEVADSMAGLVVDEVGEKWKAGTFLS
jgi:hypothetical protein